MKCAMAMMMAMLAWGAGEAVESQPRELRGFPVRIYYESACPPNMEGTFLIIAQEKASRLLAEAGIRLEWHHNKAPDGETGALVIELTFVPHAPNNYRGGENAIVLAAARPYATGNTITVFYDRVMSYMASSSPLDRAKVLGHVMAHEIVHVLQGVARHSETGLMAAHWSWRELRAMIGGGLSMAPEDRQLVRLRLERAVRDTSLAAATNRH